MYICDEQLDRLVKIFKDLSFNNDQIKRMIKKYRFYKEDVDKISESYEYYSTKMKEFGYSQFETIELAIFRPRIIFCRFCKKKDVNPSCKKILNSLKEEIVDEIENIDFKHDEIIRILKELGVKDEVINAIFKRMNEIIFLTPEELSNNIKYLTDNGLSKEDLVTILEKNAKILQYGEQDYKELLDVIEPFDMNMRDIVDIFRRQKKSLSFKMDVVVLVFRWAADKNLNKKKFKTNIKKMPNILHTPISTLDNKFNNLIKLGFSEEQAITIIDGAISVLTNDYTVIKDKIDVLGDYDIDEQERLRMITDYPGYLTMSLENIKEKLQVEYEYGFLPYIISRPKNMIQSSELTRARTYYIRRNYPNIPNDELAVIVHLPEENFIRKFRFTNIQIKVIYHNHLIGKRVLVKRQKNKMC